MAFIHGASFSRQLRLQHRATLLCAGRDAVDPRGALVEAKAKSSGCAPDPAPKKKRQKAVSDKQDTPAPDPAEPNRVHEMAREAMRRESQALDEYSRMSREVDELNLPHPAPALENLENDEGQPSSVEPHVPEPEPVVPRPQPQSLDEAVLQDKAIRYWVALLNLPLLCYVNNQHCYRSFYRLSQPQ